MVRTRGRRHHADEIIQVGREWRELIAVVIGVDVGAALALARVAFHAHPEMFRRARERGANRSDAEQPDQFSTERAGVRRVPPAVTLRRIFLEETALVRQEVREHVFGHQPPEHAARIGQDVIPAQRGIEERLDPGPGRLRPAERGHHRKDLSQERWLTEGEIDIGGARGGVRRIGGRGDAEIGKVRGVDEPVIVACVARQDQHRVHGRLSSHGSAQEPAAIGPARCFFHTPWPYPGSSCSGPA